MSESLSLELMAHLWQSTLVLGVVWLTTLALRGNRARVRYRLWQAAAITRSSVARRTERPARIFSSVC